jgi:putative phosphonate transport system ATP-binding protein
MTVRMTPLLSARAVTKQFGGRNGCRNVSFDLYPGEVLCIVGESGSGKTTLLNTLALRAEADSGTLHYHATHGDMLDLRALSEPRRRLLTRTEWGFVQQNPRDGLRSGVSAGANIGEPLMAVGARHYGQIRHTAT